ncbi:MAG: recombinase family protein, partial [Selenomonadaceae bacterium]|nr:recombinase family protein [Selenomonadaceae bacterium]
MREIRKIEGTVPQMPKRKRVAAYARVSVDSEQLLHSLSAQVSYYSNLIQNNPNWEYAGVYADEGISGTGTAKRKEFLRMISDCEAGKIDLILVKSLSRMARNTVDLLNTVRHLKEIGVEVRFERENINTLSEDGEFLLTLLASYAQCESESISENVKWGKRKKFSQGHTKGIIPPCGYKCQDDEWIIVPEEAEIVKRIFNEYLSGKAKTALADEFKAEGIRNRSGGFRDHTAIDYILRNPAYVGDVLLQKTYVTDPFSKTMKWNKGELPQYLVKNHHEPIIDRESFNKTQAELKRRGELGIFAYGVVPTSCFTQKLECGKCH